MNKFIMTPDINGFNGFGLSFADYGSVYSCVLPAGVSKVLSVPQSPFSDYPNVFAIFTYRPAGAGVWVSLNQPVTPAGPNFAVSIGELNPTGRRINMSSGVTQTLNFYTTDSDVEVCVIFLASR